MRFLKYLVAILIIVGSLLYGVYYFGTNIVSDKVMDEVYLELENSGQLEVVKQAINNDPEIMQYIENGANVDESKLPFKNKEQATRALIKKIGIDEIQDIQSKFQNGISENDLEMLLREIEGKFTHDEILALKVIAYKELNK